MMKIFQNENFENGWRSICTIGMLCSFFSRFVAKNLKSGIRYSRDRAQCGLTYQIVQLCTLATYSTCVNFFWKMLFSPKCYQNTKLYPSRSSGIIFWLYSSANSAIARLFLMAFCNRFALSMYSVWSWDKSWIVGSSFNIKLVKPSSSSSSLPKSTKYAVWYYKIYALFIRCQLLGSSIFNEFELVFWFFCWDIKNFSENGSIRVKNR